jgi:hypothetical protein
MLQLQGLINVAESFVFSSSSFCSKAMCIHNVFGTLEIFYFFHLHFCYSRAMCICNAFRILCFCRDGVIIIFTILIYFLSKSSFGKKNKKDASA